MAIREKRQKKSKKFNGKAVFVKGWDERDAFTVGNVYEFIGGRTRDDDGDVRPVLAAEPATTDCRWFREHFLQLIE